MLPINLKAPLLVMRKPFYEAFIAGTKTIEYRRHRPPFTRNAFFPDRIVRLAYNYNVKRFPSRLARVVAFDVTTAGVLGRDLASYPDLIGTYPDLIGTDEIALITLALLPE